MRDPQALISTAELAASLGNPALRYTGRISYALYIFHAPLIDILSLWYDTYTWWGALLTCAATYVIATASWFLWERPWLALRKWL